MILQGVSLMYKLTDITDSYERPDRDRFSTAEAIRGDLEYNSKNNE